MLQQANGVPIYISFAPTSEAAGAGAAQARECKRTLNTFGLLGLVRARKLNQIYIIIMINSHHNYSFLFDRFFYEHVSVGRRASAKVPSPRLAFLDWCAKNHKF